MGDESVPFPLLADPTSYDPCTLDYVAMEAQGLPGNREWIEVFRKVTRAPGASPAPGEKSVVPSVRSSAPAEHPIV